MFVKVRFMDKKVCMNGKHPVTVELELILETALGINADLLVRMQADYNMQVTRESNTLTVRLKRMSQIDAAL